MLANLASCTVTSYCGEEEEKEGEEIGEKEGGSGKSRGRIQITFPCEGRGKKSLHSSVESQQE